MKTKEKARKLAKQMIEIGKLANRETVCVLTNMDEPLGYAVGNSLEVIEAIEFLNGNIIEDVKEVVLELGANMLKLAGIGEDIEQNKEILMKNIKNGKAFEKFKELVQMQGGDITYLEDVEKFQKAKYIEYVYSEEKGYIRKIDAKEIGKIVCELGAGRIEKEDEIDYSVGLILRKKVSDKVAKGEEIAYIYANDTEKLGIAKQKLLKNIKISEEKVEKPKIVLGKEQ